MRFRLAKRLILALVIASLVFGQGSAGYAMTASIGLSSGASEKQSKSVIKQAEDTSVSKHHGKPCCPSCDKKGHETTKKILCAMTCFTAAYIAVLPAQQNATQNASSFSYEVVSDIAVSQVSLPIIPPPKIQINKTTTL